MAECRAGRGLRNVGEGDGGEQQAPGGRMRERRGSDEQATAELDARGWEGRRRRRRRRRKSSGGRMGGGSES